MLDVLFRGALVCDGSGHPAFLGDVGVVDGRIAFASADAADLRAHRVIDASGLVLAPGLIDFHSHADLTLPAYPGATNSIRQGVTTEVVGNCGFSAAPVSTDPALASELRMLLAGLGPDLDWTWTSFGEYLDQFDAVHPAVNVVPLVGHHALRIAAMGFEGRPSTAKERKAMQLGLAKALEDGAWGMSTGLMYPPGAFADTDELIQIGGPLRAHGALYATHLRNEADDVLDAVDEAIAIGESLGVRVQISHLKAAGTRNRGLAGRALDRLASARARGLSVSCDAYPYTAACTFLSQVLPPWVQEGGIEKMLERLPNEATRMRIRAELARPPRGWSSYVELAGGWQNVLVARTVSAASRWAEGLNVAEAAARRGIATLDLALELLVQDRGGTLMIVFLMDDEDVATVLRHPATVIGSDQVGVTAPDTRVHPRAYGSFARLLGWGVRESRILELEDAVCRMTGRPASILGLHDRGAIAPGLIADLMLFDPTTIADMATYQEPTRPARGVEFVMIGGRLAVDAGVAVNPRLGRVLRRRRSTSDTRRVRAA